jgi:hypothetical protein
MGAMARATREQVARLRALDVGPRTVEVARRAARALLVEEREEAR